MPNASSIPPQRWVNPAVDEVPPGFWKRQLPVKVLSLAVRGDIAGLRIYLNEHPEDLNRRGNHNRTFLWETAWWGRRAAAEWLIERGAEVDATGSYNNETMVQITPFCAALHRGHDDLGAFLLSHGAKLDVFRAAFMGNWPLVKDMLDAEPALLNAEDPHDDIYFMPLVAFAVAGGHMETTQRLLDRGAAILPYSALLLHLAAHIGRIDLVNLLLSHGVDARAVDGGIFVSCKDLRILQVLVDHGASVHRAGINGMTPLAFAVRADKGNRIALVQWLLAHGADVNVADATGKTALHVAAAAGHPPVIRLLIDYGGDCTLKDSSGQTPRDIAKAKGKLEAARMLI